LPETLPMATRLPLLAAGLLLTCTATASDWPTFRGPNRDGVSKETGLRQEWPKDGPRTVWTAKNLGLGFGAPTVAEGRVFGLGTRDGKDGVWALKEADGSEMWFTSIDEARRPNQNNGASGSPTFNAGKVYAVSSKGKLACLDAASGNVAWRVDLVKDFGGSIQSWGYTESVLIDGDKLICTPGGKNTLVALNPSNGDVIWKAAVPKADAAQYSSVVAADIAGERQYLQFVRGGVVSVRASDGAYLWRYDAPANGTANCSAPIHHEGYVFASSNYGTGGGLVRVTKTDGGFDAKEVYFTKKMQNHHGGMVLVDGYLYGDGDGSLRCIEFKTGKVAWEEGTGKGSITYADGHLYFRDERGGNLWLIEANPKEFVLKGKFKQTDRSNERAWAYPVIANGKLYVRDQGIMHCYDIKGDKN
jgi:outer membrane protein assembly factor BamB